MKKVILLAGLLACSGVWAGGVDGNKYYTSSQLDDMCPTALYGFSQSVRIAELCNYKTGSGQLSEESFNLCANHLNKKDFYSVVEDAKASIDASIKKDGLKSTCDSFKKNNPDIFEK